jgi:hypothetical protein
MGVKPIFIQLSMVYESASRLLIPELKSDHRWGKNLAASMFALDTMLAAALRAWHGL